MNRNGNHHHHHQHNAGDGDLYKVLGVSRDASSSDIRKAYRKLALQYHPDRLGDGATPEERESSAATFTRISNAYEVLGDESQRRDYDARDAMPPHAAFGGGGGAASAAPPFHFTDPFALFEQVFAAEFGMPQGAAPQRGGGFPFSPSSPFMGGSFMMNDMFGGAHHAFGGGGHEPFRHDPFFGGGGGGGGGAPGNAFFHHFNMMQQEQLAMQQQMANHQARVQHMMGGGGGGGGGGMPQSAFYSSSSSSSSFGGPGESVSTTTRVINGKKQVVTERVTRMADGTVERKVETTTDDDFPRHFLEGQGQPQGRLIEGGGGGGGNKGKGRRGRRNQE